MKIKGLMIVSLSAGFLFLLSSTLWADVQTTTFQVNARVVSFCLIGNNPSDMSTAYFYSGHESTRAVVISCAMGTPYTVIMEKEVAVNKKANPSPANVRSYGLATHYPRYAYEGIRNMTASLAVPTYNDVSGPIAIPTPPPAKPKPATSSSHVKYTVNF